MPLVSVVMPVYCSERFVAEAIESILQQTLTSLELLIVNDGSSDKSGEIIKDFAKRDSRVRSIELPENRGESAARNTGIALATGKYVTGMDSDDVSLPRRLEKQVAFLNARPDIGGVGVFHRVCNEELSPTVTPQLPTCHHSIVLSLVLYTRTAMKFAPIMVRRKYFDKQPPYDPNIKYGADLNVFLRLLWENGIRYANVPEALYLCRRHANTMGSRYQATERELYFPPRRIALQRLGAAGMGAEWILEKHPIRKLNWNERRRARRDISRLIGAMVEHNWVDAEDEPLLYAEMNQLVESTSPRYWQMFLHWYSYRIARRFPRIG